MHSVCPPNFASTIVAECSWEYADLPRVFHNNSLCKIWGANRVHYGQLENSEYDCVEAWNPFKLTIMEYWNGRPLTKKKSLATCFCMRLLLLKLYGANKLSMGLGRGGKKGICQHCLVFEWRVQNVDARYRLLEISYLRTSGTFFYLSALDKCK